MQDWFDWQQLLENSYHKFIVGVTSRWAQPTHPRHVLVGPTHPRAWRIYAMTPYKVITDENNGEHL